MVPPYRTIFGVVLSAIWVVGSGQINIMNYARAEVRIQGNIYLCGKSQFNVVNSTVRLEDYQDYQHVIFGELINTLRFS